MGFTKYAPTDLKYLANRLRRLESDVKALKMERRVGTSAISDGRLRILDYDSKVVRAQFGKISEGLYGVRINDAEGNLLINLYDPANYNIKKPVKIESAYDSGWQLVPAPGSYKILTHNLGYFPSENLLWSGNANPPTLVFDESYWHCLYTGWISTTQIEILMAEDTDPGLTPVFRVVLFR